MTPILVSPAFTNAIAVSTPASVFGTLLLFGLAIAKFVILLRSLLLLPTFPIAVPGASWRGAWQDSNVKMLRFLGTLFPAMLPVLGFVIVLSLVAAPVAAVVVSRLFQSHANTLTQPGP
ncbi:MAG: hypothetical protein EXR05_01945 [Acetobacteraceae bacterium]|nr:hypothetical protein [Acetobacteraceae bacterium]MSP29702.1 hypothetical protein [Acetobacteraceae bacterium]